MENYDASSPISYCLKISDVTLKNKQTDTHTLLLTSKGCTQSQRWLECTKQEIHLRMTAGSSHRSNLAKWVSNGQPLYANPTKTLSTRHLTYMDSFHISKSLF